MVEATIERRTASMRTEFGARLMRVAPLDRDAWVDRELGIGEVPDDEAIPDGCVPYLPSSVASIVDAIERAHVTSEDVFVDVGSGIGRVLALVHLLTGARTVGIEIQEALVRRATAISERLGVSGVRTLTGDAERLVDRVSDATVFFFYCPFDKHRLTRVVQALEPLARVRALRLCFVDTAPPDLPWIERLASPADSHDSLVVCRTLPPQG